MILFALLLAAAPAPPDRARAPTGQASDAMAAVAAIKARKAELDARSTERRCLGADAVTCLASIGYYVYITLPPPEIAAGELKLPGAVEHDIHGAPISQMVSLRVSFTPGPKALASPDLIDVTIFLEDGEHVSRVTFFLPESPAEAKTEDQWRATRVFELATAAMGDQCIGADRLAFYRRYDDAQRGDGARRRISRLDADPSVSSSVQGHVSLCGARMSMTTVGGMSMDAGLFAGSLMAFEVVR